jgi:hypothetical protein
MSDGVVSRDAVGGSLAQEKTLLWLWSGYQLLVPFYFMGRTLNPGTQKFESGVPQIADYYFVIIALLVFFKLPVRFPRAATAIVAAIAAFVGYTALINSIWAAELEDTSLLKSTMFYAYDCVLFATCLMLYGAFKEQFLRFTLAGVSASIILQAVLSPFVQDFATSRQALFFNDANQLGYYCLLAATIFVAGARRFAVPWSYQAVFYAALIYLAAISQCRAALLALAVLAVVAFLDRPVRLLVAVGALGAIYSLVTLNPTVLGKGEERLVVEGRYDSMEARGYDRILNHPEYVLFGAGEGAYNRFRSTLFGSEIHSAFGTLLFSYGIPGLLIFCSALLLIAAKDAKTAMYLVPTFVFVTAHHGLRFAFFWTVMAFICCLAIDAAQDRAAKTVVST